MKSETYLRIMHTIEIEECELCKAALVHHTALTEEIIQRYADEWDRQEVYRRDTSLFDEDIFGLCDDEETYEYTEDMEAEAFSAMAHSCECELRDSVQKVFVASLTPAGKEMLAILHQKGVKMSYAGTELKEFPGNPFGFYEV